MQITVWGANSHTEAIKKLDFNWGLGWYPEETCVQYYDLVIPAPIYFFEEPKDETTGTPSSRTRFNSGGGNNNFFIYQEPAIAPLGEVRPIAWWWTELGRRFNIADKYEPLLYDISVGTWKIDEWNKRMEDLHKTAYETWAKLPTITPFHPPTWDDFKKNPFFMVDANPLYSWQAVIAQNQNPFPSRKSYDLTLVPSGKIEIDVPFLADAAKMASTQWEPDGQGCLGRVNTDVVKSMPMWIPQGYGRFLDKRVANYPLTMLSSKTVYRQHSCDDNNPLLRDEAYQHAVWMSVADAKMRGVVDGDLVRVYSEAGETVIPAYVTPRITPGVVDVMAISWYKPSQTKTNLMPDGIDRGGSCNFLIGDPMQEKPDTVTCIKTVQVEVEKF
jgi:anaerobic dimethyl sulfoxide reductase subunit A